MNYFAIVLNKFILVHAGINFLFPPAGGLESMLWLRNFNIDKNLLGTKKIIHGHSPVPFPKIAESILFPYVPVIDIDAGCVYTTGRPWQLGCAEPR